MRGVGRQGRDNQQAGGPGSGTSPGKMKMKKELMPPMMPMISPRSGRNKAMARVTVTHRTVSSPEGLARALGPHARQQLLLQKSCSTDLEAPPHRLTRLQAPALSPACLRAP